MGESKHKCSALKSSRCELPAFERFVVIWGESSAIYTAQGRLVLFRRAEDWGLHFLSE